MTRRASAQWSGNLARGDGTIAADTGAFGPLPYSLASRTAAHDGKTSPEELLAAAHAGCYAMSLAAELANAGVRAEHVDVFATITLDEVEGKGHQIVASELLARARVHEVEPERLAQIASIADEGCPFSALIRASGTVTVKAEPEGGTNGD